MNQHRRRVLIIEDNPDGRESLGCLLSLWGFEVETAQDGLEGVCKALDWHPDAITVDIGLPLLDGYEVARRIRASQADHVYLIALTAYASDSDRRQATESGFDAFLPKPEDLQELQRLLTSH